MRIPDGDLMPARRRRHSRGYSGGYARGRRRRTRRMALVLLVLVVAAATAWYLRRDGAGSPQALAACPTPTAQPTSSATAPPLPTAAQVRVVVLNGTVRQGLAHSVATALHARGFVVVRQDNSPSALAGASVVTYAPGLQGAATLLARHVAGARVSTPGQAPAGTVQVVLGSDFRRLSTPAEVAAASARTAVVPAPTATGTRPPCGA